jgi:uncharacterized protein
MGFGPGLLVALMVPAVVLAGCSSSDLSVGRSDSAADTASPAAARSSGPSSAAPRNVPSATSSTTPPKSTPPVPTNTQASPTVSAKTIRVRSQRLIKAARAGEVGEVRQLLSSGARVAARDDSGATALVAAAYGNHVTTARVLLEAGADPNAKDETVQSAYLIATSEIGDDPRLLELTLAHGADVGSLDSWRGTGLIRAAHRGYYKIIDVLLGTKIDVDHINRINYTALHEAVVLGDGGVNHQKTVAALVRAGADVSIRDGAGRTAKQMAEERGYERIAELIG